MDAPAPDGVRYVKEWVLGGSRPENKKLRKMKFKRCQKVTKNESCPISYIVIPGKVESLGQCFLVVMPSCFTFILPVVICCCAPF